MRISDWSSDVCSSDLYVRLVGGNAEHAVAEDAAVLVQDPRRVIGAQAVAEDAVGPRDRVCALLDLPHPFQVLLPHLPHPAFRRLYIVLASFWSIFFPFF